VLLHSRWMYDRGSSKRSAFNFISETRGGPGGHLLFDNGSPKVLTLNTLNGHQNFAVDLGTADFEQELEPGRISIDGRRVFAADVPTVEGHVYLERVHDSRGNDFFALFQIIHVDPQGRYVAFLWRKLPGGSVVTSPD
jgi:hypothetical protein